MRREKTPKPRRDGASCGDSGEIFEQLMVLQRQAGCARARPARRLAVHWEEVFDDEEAAAEPPNEEEERRALLSFAPKSRD